MSRRNNVRGPTSALTEFLKESGITPTTIARRARTRQVEQPAQLEAGPSNAQQNGDQPESGPRGTNGNAEEYASDHLDETDEEQPAQKKRKMTKTAEAKEKAKAKANAKKKKGDDEDFEDSDEDEDAYTALSKMWKDNSKPPVGSFENCARCNKQFTTKYTMAANPPPGFLCHLCAKASGADPFKKPAAPRKRKAATEKRNVVHFEERRFPSLASLCIKIISHYIDDVEALGDIGSINLDELAKSLARNRSLTPQNAPLFYNVENTNLTLYDVTHLTPPAFNTLAALNPNLTSLRLDFCGRIDDTVMDSWTTSLPHLKRIELLGPFLIRIAAWKKFFETHPNLEGFLITQSPRFDLECTKAMVDNCKNIKELRLNEIGKMDDAILNEIKQYGEQLTYLEIAYPGVPEALSDDVVVDLMSAVGASLKHLNLSNNVNLTDGFLFQGLKPHARQLSTLVLANLPELTDAGVAEFFDTWKAAVQDHPNRALVNLDLSRNHELSDKALISLLKHSKKSLTNLNINGWKTTSQEVLKGIARQCPRLQKLDISWCREVDDWVIKELVEKCDKIQEVKVWGCQRLSLQCPRKRGVTITGVEIHVAA
ncbi:unnamed protein product [Somion occarium]|uniref:DNA repair protein rhp7 treble clef domain-containing protein n=1 Tax=Somion occarium TaxID=3059160 RepID=A0ABP1D8T3_9APHY